jgi:hypothetical protein
VITKKHVKQLKSKFDQGEHPRLSNKFWRVLSWCISLNKYDDYRDYYMAMLESPECKQYAKALISFGLITNKYAPTKLGTHYYNNWRNP